VRNKGQVFPREFSASQLLLTYSGGKAATRAQALHMWEAGFHAQNKNESLKNFFFKLQTFGWCISGATIY